MTTIIDNTILAKTRAEEHDADVWGEFFIPPYFNRLNLKSATKPTYIIGKRGCGKTMLLKYLDYHTAFSKKRTNISQDEISHIGIYWRVDTQFCSSLKHRGIDEENWISIFEGYFSLCIAIEILRSLKTIAESKFPNFGQNELNSLNFSSVKDFHESFPENIIGLEKFLESTRRLFSTWISNISQIPQPLIPPGHVFLDAIIADIKNFGVLKDAAVYVYIDEIENLVPYQRRVLNTFLKHSQKPLIINFTSKEQSRENRTVGNEWVNGTHDYRLLDLDSLLKDGERPLFFSEVFLGNLHIAKAEHGSDLLEVVRSPDRLLERKEKSYKAKIISEMKERFPTKTLKQFSQDAINNEKIKKKLFERIEKALKGRGEEFRYQDFDEFMVAPEAVVLLPALFNRSSLVPKNVLKSLRIYISEGSGPFQTTWIENNLFGSLLELYRPYGRECPIYSGFETICTMSNNNLRNYLILSYKAIEIADLKDESSFVLSIETQCRAAYEAADQLVREIKTFGQFGEQLRMFVLRLGSIFRALQASLPMSEPEQNQLTINSGDRNLNDDERSFITEAMKYAILVEQLETKAKDSIGVDIVDYQLNPIYAPYFQISYRRKRKIEISVDQFHTLYAGTEDEYKQLAKLFSKEIIETGQKQLGLI